MNIVNCNKCKNINMTEEEQFIDYLQTNRMSGHMCLLHYARVRHHSMENIIHNMIYPCSECDGKDFQKREGK